MLQNLTTLSLASHNLSTSLGGSRPFAILDSRATLFDRRFCVQRDVHTEEYGAHSEHLRTPS
jgi:hypothetical protein